MREAHFMGVHERRKGRPASVNPFHYAVEADLRRQWNYGWLLEDERMETENG